METETEMMMGWGLNGDGLEIEWNGMGCFCIGWYGTCRDRMIWYGIRRDGTGWDGMEWDGTGQDQIR